MVKRFNSGFQYFKHVLVDNNHNISGKKRIQGAKMKLDDDFSAMFLIVDASNKGFLTSKEVADFYQTLFCHEVGTDMVKNCLFK